MKWNVNLRFNLSFDLTFFNQMESKVRMTLNFQNSKSGTLFRVIIMSFMRPVILRQLFHIFYSTCVYVTCNCH